MGVVSFCVARNDTRFQLVTCVRGICIVPVCVSFTLTIRWIADVQTLARKTELTVSALMVQQIAEIREALSTVTANQRVRIACNCANMQKRSMLLCVCVLNNIYVLVVARCQFAPCL